MSNYRARSPPRRYADPRDPRASTGPSLSLAPYDSRTPRYDRQYAAQPINRRTYHDDGYAATRTNYAVRPRGSSFVEPDHRRASSVTPLGPMSPPRPQPVVMNTHHDQPRSRRLEIPRDADRYLQPAAPSSGRHHARHHSATPADLERLVPARGDGRDRGPYYRPPPPPPPPPPTNSARNYTRTKPPVVDDSSYSYTGPREQFTRDMQRRDQVRRDRPMSVVEIPSVDSAARRDLGPPSASSGHFDRIDRLDPRRMSLRGAGDSDRDRRTEMPRRHNSVRVPVVHQPRDDRYPAPKDDYDDRKSHRVGDYPDEREHRKSKDHGRYYDRESEDWRGPAPRRDEDRRHLRSRENSLERAPAVKGPALRPDDSWKPQRSHESSPERIHRGSVSKGASDPRRKPRSREASSDRSGLVQGLAATSIGGLAAAGVANGLSKPSKERSDGSEDEARKERRRRRNKERDETHDRNEEAPRRSKDVLLDGEDDSTKTRRDRNGEKGSSDSQDDHHRHRHHRRRRHHHEDEDPGAEHPSESGSDRPGVAAPREVGRDRKDYAESDSDRPRLLEDEHPVPVLMRPPNGETRTISPGEDEDNRPRRVQLVAPAKDGDSGPKPRGILKPPRAVPFPEDPNPVREGVAPLNGPGKDLPPDARWTKVNRILVNPEALRQANERYEEFEDYVIVLRVLSKEDINKLAVLTHEIREERQREKEEEHAEKKDKRRGSHRDHHDDHDYSDEEEDGPPPMAIEPSSQSMPPPPPPQVYPPQAAHASMQPPPVDPRAYQPSPDPLGRSNPGQPVTPTVNIVPDTYSEQV